jgi:hypothetical protein
MQQKPCCLVGGLLGALLTPGALPFPAAQLKASRFLALGRTSLWWMTPAWGSSTQQVGCNPCTGARLPN